MSTTGEQPAFVAPPIGERSTFDWKVMTAVFFAAVAIGSAHYRLETVDRKQGDLEQRLSRDEQKAGEEQQRASDVDHQKDLRLQRMEDAIPRIFATLESISQRLDRPGGR